MWRAYPRHSINLSAGCYGAAFRTLAQGNVLEGPEVAAFEDAFARYIGARHAVGVSSGRAALYLSLKALGFHSGDEIILPAYTFHIVPLVIRACGLIPVFVDVMPDTYNMNPELIPRHITPRTKAILATHMYGQPCDLAPMLQIAKDHGLKVLEDCAHACGAAYKGRKVGVFGDVGLFTFAMAKNMPCFGGGMLTTNDPDLYQRLRESVRPPQTQRRISLGKEVATTTFAYLCTLPNLFRWAVFPLMRALTALGANVFDREAGQEKVSPVEVQTAYATRLTNLQASVGLHQLTRIDGINAALNRNAQIYNTALGRLKGIRVPQVSSERTHTFLYYRLEVENREALRARLIRWGVDTNPDDMSDCTTLAPFRSSAADAPIARGLPQKIMEIPNNPRLRETDVRFVARAIEAVLNGLSR